MTNPARSQRIRLTAALALGLAAAPLAHAQPAPKELIDTMLNNEHAAAGHKPMMSYLSVEKSDRTQGHTWTERVVETPACRVRLLLAIDGQPLRADMAQAERNRLANDAAHPDEYAARERQLTGSEDIHAQSMLDLIGKGFFLEHVQSVGPDWHIDFHPDPAFSPSGSEEKVLHGMSGWVAIDQKSMRLRHIEGKLPEDVSLYGFLATVHAGSHFVTDKAPIDGSWRTSHVVTQVLGKAVLFKNISKNMDATRSEFKLVPPNLTVAQAVELAEK